MTTANSTSIPVIYIAGPFRGPNHWVIHSNVEKAQALALKVWELGGAAVCPHKNTEYYQGSLPDEVWLRGDLAILAKCDALLLVDGWLLSEGARGELAFAVDKGIPVFATLADLKRWMAGWRSAEEAA